ncbi:hypothetical protein ROJ8625_01910 [Roseivivax jejudonensis]|uniref:Tetratricopeptide repeat protein 38 n=1 Tax=Roseivivax jejudonensis TaxID=1529041 RepID=A0A1X6Z4Y1_9RHOB|nr:tetratricopeptide repeat protein [Roseivivax jejudonensis]SLN40506.1 hypothetical protein ROJ8625_01910 [Roseivivax jejudonensis]
MAFDLCRADCGLDDPEALAAWNAMIVAFLAHSKSTPDHLANVLDRSPDAAMPLAAKGLFCLMLGRAEMTEAARGAYSTARAALTLGGAPARARAWTDALGCWLDGAPSGAVFHLESVLSATPEDTLTLKVVHGIRFILGDAGGMRRSVERALAGHAPDHPLRGYAMGCHAFALEETGAYTEAEGAGRAGLALCADDAWGLHAVAHVHDMTHRPGDGIALIDENRRAWDHCNNFRYHVWWHKALLHLDRGEHDLVLDLYDTQIRAEHSDDYRDVANASSLLMRLELEGVTCGDRWHELGDLAERRLSDGCLVFADLHYMLALAGDHRPGAAARLAARIGETGAPRTEHGRLYDHPGHAAAEGLAAFGEGQYAVAFERLRAARAHLPTIGGSHAQRDVFERITVDAGLRAGRLDDAEAILTERTVLRDGHADAFAETRRSAIDDARAGRPLYEAQRRSA